VGKAKAAEIDEIIKSSHPDLHRGDKSYPGIYQQAVTELMRNMSGLRRIRRCRSCWRSGRRRGRLWMSVSSGSNWFCLQRLADFETELLKNMAERP
jgi:hypothetical protein